MKNGLANDDRDGYDGNSAKQSDVEVGHSENITDKVAVGIRKVENELSEEGEIDDLEEGELKSDEDSITGSIHSSEKSTRRSVSFTLFLCIILRSQNCLTDLFNGSSNFVQDTINF